MSNKNNFYHFVYLLSLYDLTRSPVPASSPCDLHKNAALKKSAKLEEIRKRATEKIMHPSHPDLHKSDKQFGTAAGHQVAFGASRCSTTGFSTVLERGYHQITVKGLLTLLLYSFATYISFEMEIFGKDSPQFKEVLKKIAVGLVGSYEENAASVEHLTNELADACEKYENVFPKEDDVQDHAGDDMGLWDPYLSDYAKKLLSDLKDTYFA